MISTATITHSVYVIWDLVLVVVLEQFSSYVSTIDQVDVKVEIFLNKFNVHSKFCLIYFGSICYRLTLNGSQDMSNNQW